MNLIFRSWCFRNLIVFVLEIIPSLVAAHPMDILLDRSGWISACEQARATYSGLFPRTPRPIDLPSAAEDQKNSGISLLGVNVPTLGRDVVVTSFDIDHDSVSAFLHFSEGYRLLIEKDVPTVLKNLWAPNVGDSALIYEQETKRILGGSFTIQELSAEAYEAEPESMLCTQETVAEDQRTFVLMLLRDAKSGISERYNASALGMNGYTVVYNSDGMVEIFTSLYDHTQAFTIRALFSKSNEYLKTRYLQMLSRLESQE